MDAASGQILGELEGRTGRIVGLAWSPDDMRLSSVGRDDQIVRLMALGNPVRRFKSDSHKDFFDVAWPPNCQQIASASVDKDHRIWNAETGLQQYALEGHTDEVVSASFLDSGRLPASLSDKGAVIFGGTDDWARARSSDVPHRTIGTHAGHWANVSMDRLSRDGVPQDLAGYPCARII